MKLHTGTLLAGLVYVLVGVGFVLEGVGLWIVSLPDFRVLGPLLTLGAGFAILLVSLGRRRASG